MMRRCQAVSIDEEPEEGDTCFMKRTLAECTGQSVLGGSPDSLCAWDPYFSRCKGGQAETESGDGPMMPPFTQVGEGSNMGVNIGMFSNVLSDGIGEEGIAASVACFQSTTCTSPCVQVGTVCLNPASFTELQKAQEQPKQEETQQEPKSIFANPLMWAAFGASCGFTAGLTSFLCSRKSALSEPLALERV